MESPSILLKNDLPLATYKKIDVDLSELSSQFHTQKTIVFQNHIFAFVLFQNELICWDLNLETSKWKRFSLEGDAANNKYESFELCGDNNKIILFGTLSKEKKYKAVMLKPDLKSLRMQCDELFMERLIVIPINSAFILYEDKIYVFGGRSSDFFSVPINNLSSLPLNKNVLSYEEVIVKSELNIPKPRESPVCVVYSNKLFIYGGYDINNKILSDFWKFDFETGEWKQLNSDGPELDDPILLTYNEEIFLLNSNKNNPFLILNPHNIFSFHFETNSWTLISKISLDVVPFCWTVDRQKLLMICEKYIYSMDIGVSNETSNNVIEKPESTITLPNSTFIKDFRELLFKEKKYTDISFRVENQIITAHKNILAARCRYFDNMFSSGMKESTQSIIEVNDMSLPAFNGLMESIYCDEVSLSEKLAFELIQIADKYSIGPLKTACENYLISSLTVSNVIDSGILANDLQANELIKGVVQFISNNLDDVFQHTDIKKLPSSILYLVMKRK